MKSSGDICVRYRRERREPYDLSCNGVSSVICHCPDNEGRMIKAANLGYQEGQVVGEIIARQAPKAPILFRLAPLAAAACLCLAVLGGGGHGAYGMPYGTVEVRINPDVKMSVSYMDRVVGLEGVNEDGKNSLTRCHIREGLRIYDRYTGGTGHGNGLSD